MENNDLRMLVGNNETIMWEGKPDKKCFVLESIFNPMLIFALIWAAFDSVFIVSFFNSDENGGGYPSGMGMVILLFFAVHLMPVWIYIAGVFTSVLKHKNTYYIVTDRAVYLSSGVLTKNTDVKLFADISNVSFHRGMFDQMLGVGDIIIVSDAVVYNGGYYGNSTRNVNRAGKLELRDIREYERVFKMIKDLQTDIYADTMYPNALRPENNPGYNTKYTKDW